MSDSVDERNMKLTLSTIQEDTREAAKKLSETYAEHDAEKVALEATRSLHRLEREKMDEERKIHVDAHASLDRRSADLDARKERSDGEVTVCREQVGEAMKELRRLNEWISTADEEWKRKQETLKEIDEKISTKKALVEEILSLENKRVEEERSLGTVRLETSLLIEDTDKRVAEKLVVVADAERRKDEVEKRLVEATNELEKVLNERERINADLQIYIARIREKYKEVFPDRDLIL